MSFGKLALVCVMLSAFDFLHQYLHFFRIILPWLPLHLRLKIIVLKRQINEFLL